MAPATKGKKTGKENAPPAKTKAVEMDPDDSFGDVSMELPAVTTKGSKPASKGVKGKKDDTDEEPEEAGSSSDISRKLASVTAERDRLKKHRDEVSKQFEELARLRNTESEKLFSRYKETAETAATAQNDIIANLTTLNERQSARISSLEKSLAAASLRASSQAAPVEAPSAPAPIASTSTLSKSEAKELKALREEVGKLRSGVKEKDTKISQLEQEYKAEVANSLSLQRSTRGAPSTSTAAAQPDSEDAEKDQLSLAFYEDMTELAILNVKIRRDPKNGKEATLNCLYTNQETRRTLQFTIRTYQEISQDLVAAKAENPWVRMVHYQPESLASETDKEFVKRLGVFSEEFSIERKQLGQMWDDLRAKVSGEEDEDEDDE